MAFASPSTPQPSGTHHHHPSQQSHASPHHAASRGGHHPHGGVGFSPRVQRDARGTPGHLTSEPLPMPETAVTPSSDGVGGIAVPHPSDTSTSLANDGNGLTHASTFGNSYVDGTALPAAGSAASRRTLRDYLTTAGLSPRPPMSPSAGSPAGGRRPPMSGSGSTRRPPPGATSIGPVVGATTTPHLSRMWSPASSVLSQGYGAPTIKVRSASGQIIHALTIVKPIGEGTTGEVLLASDSHGQYAIKTTRRGDVGDAAALVQEYVVYKILQVPQPRDYPAPFPGYPVAALPMAELRRRKSAARSTGGDGAADGSRVTVAVPTTNVAFQGTPPTEAPPLDHVIGFSDVLYAELPHKFPLHELEYLPDEIFVPQHVSLHQHSDGPSIVGADSASGDLQSREGSTPSVGPTVAEGSATVVMEYLGPSLEELRKYCLGAFDEHTVLMLADDLVGRIEHLHRCGLVHRDLKPENICMHNRRQGEVPPSRSWAAAFVSSRQQAPGSESRRGKAATKIVQTPYLIDFGFTAPYVKVSLKEIHAQRLKWEQISKLPHVDNKPDNMFVGTSRYCSPHAQRGFPHTRRDDLMALLYVLVYLADGTLPWTSVNIAKLYKEQGKARPEVIIPPSADAQTRQRLKDEAQRKEVSVLKDAISMTDLCKNCPYLLPFATVINGLSFAERPPYGHLRFLVRHQMALDGLPYDREQYAWIRKRRDERERR